MSDTRLRELTDASISSIDTGRFMLNAGIKPYYQDAVTRIVKKDASLRSYILKFRKLHPTALIHVRILLKRGRYSVLVKAIVGSPVITPEKAKDLLQKMGKDHGNKFPMKLLTSFEYEGLISILARASSSTKPFRPIDGSVLTAIYPDINVLLCIDKENAKKQQFHVGVSELIITDDTIVTNFSA